MLTFMEWLQRESRLSYPIAKYIIDIATKNPLLTGKDIARMMHGYGYEVDYAGVMSILTPHFQAIKREKRLASLSSDQPAKKRKLNMPPSLDKAYVYTPEIDAEEEEKRKRRRDRTFTFNQTPKEGPAFMRPDVTPWSPLYKGTGGGYRVSVNKS